jgi:hypothetical protein
VETCLDVDHGNVAQAAPGGGKGRVQEGAGEEFSEGLRGGIVGEEIFDDLEEGRGGRGVREGRGEGRETSR